MNRNALLVAVLSLTLVQLVSCVSHQVYLRKTQTSLNYSDKFPLKVGVYFPPEFTKYEMSIPVLGDYCKETSFPIPSLGHGFADAVYEGTKTAVRDIAFFKNLPDSVILDSAKIKYFVVPKIDSTSGSIQYAEGTFANVIKAEFKGYLGIDVKGRDGKTVRHFDVSGKNTSNGSGDCLDGAEVIGRAIDIVLQDIADDLARTIHDSDTIRKSLK